MRHIVLRDISRELKLLMESLASWAFKGDSRRPLSRNKAMVVFSYRWFQNVGMIGGCKWTNDSACTKLRPINQPIRTRVRILVCAGRRYSRNHWSRSIGAACWSKFTREMGKKKSRKSGLDAAIGEKHATTPENGNGTTEEEEEYEVEKVVDKRINKDKVEYWLKWKGYSSADNTWESEESLDCPELLQEYEKRRRLEKQSVDVKKEKKEKRKEPR